MTQEPIEKFWMVWGFNRDTPRYRHPTKEAAQTEAKRLARANPDQLFVVLAAVDAFISTVLPPEKVGLVKPDGQLKPLDSDIPF